MLWDLLRFSQIGATIGATGPSKLGNDVSVRGQSHVKSRIEVAERSEPTTVAIVAWSRSASQSIRGVLGERAFQTVARRMKAEADDVSVDSKVFLIANDDRSFDLGVQLDVTLPSMDTGQAVELVEAAHRVCPYSNATRGDIEVELTATGEAVG